MKRETDFAFHPWRPVWKPVSASVEFNGELCGGAVKIEKVNAALILPAEFEFGKATVAEQTPETFFGVSGFLAKWRAKLRATTVRVRCLP